MAVIATLLALLLRLMLGAVIVPSVFLTFYGAVLLSAWYGGFGASAVATGLSALFGILLFLPAPLSPAGETQLTLLRIVLFVVISSGLSWVTVALRASQRRIAQILQSAHDELEAGVAARTAELHTANQRLTEEIGRRAEAEEHFRNSFEYAPIGMALVSADGQPLQINTALCRMLGYTYDELMRKPIAEVMHPDDLAGANADRARLLAGNVDSYRAERRYLHRSGRVVWVEMSVSLVRDRDGRPLNLVSHLHDITQRKLADQVLQESEGKFRALAETVPVATCIFQGPVVRYVNPAAAAITGYTREELLTMHFWDVIHPEHRELMRERGLARQRGEPLPAHDEVMIVTKSGETRWVDFSAGMIDFEGGRAVLGTAFDVTDRKSAELVLEDRVVQRTLELSEANRLLREEIRQRQEAEDALRGAEERLRRLVEQLPAITYVLALDDAQSTLYISPQVETTLGFTPGEWMADPDLWSRQLHPHDRGRVIAEVAHSHATGAPFSSDYRMYTRDGALLWFHDEAVVIRDEAGALQFSQGVMIDITARKQAEEELEATNRRTHTILEEITAGFFALDQAGCFTYLNPSVLRLLGRSRDDLLGKNIWETFPAAVGSIFHEQYLRVMAERVPLDTESYYPPLNRWFRVHAYPSQQGIAVLFEDVTETHEKEVAVLSDILRALNAELDVAAAFPLVTTGLQVLTECDRSTLTFFDPDDQEATVAAVSGSRNDVTAGTRLRMSDIPAAANMVAGRPHIVPDLAVEVHSPIVQRIYADGFRSVLCLPLRGRERVLGMLTLTWRKLDGGSASPLPLLNQVADAVALATEKSHLFEEVRAGRERLETLSRRLLEVQEAERQHIARELHDEIGQVLTALKLSLDTAVGLSDDGAVPRLNASRRQVNELVARVRNLALDLRPAMLDDLGLLPALLWFFGRYSEQTGVQVGFEHRGLERRFSAEIETAAYRIVQEALTNVARHAGVQQVTVRAWRDQNTLSVQIIDQGTGFEPTAALTSGLTSGVSGMRERALLLGGHLRVESERGKGTQVSAELPLDEGADEVTACL